MGKNRQYTKELTDEEIVRIVMWRMRGFWLRREAMFDEEDSSQQAWVFLLEKRERWLALWNGSTPKTTWLIEKLSYEMRSWYRDHRDGPHARTKRRQANVIYWMAFRNGSADSSFETPLDYLEILADPSQNTEETALRGLLVDWEILESYILQVPGRNGEILRRLVLNNEHARDIASEYGLGESRLSQIRTQELQSIGRVLWNRGFRP